MNATGTQEPASIHTQKKYARLVSLENCHVQLIDVEKKAAKLLEWQKLWLNIVYIYKWHIYIYIYTYMQLFMYMIYVYGICIWYMYLFVYLQANVCVSTHPICTFTRSGSNHYGPLPAVSPALFPWSGKVQRCVARNRHLGTPKFTGNPDCPF